MRPTRIPRIIAVLAVIVASVAAVPGATAAAADSGSTRGAHAVVKNTAGTVLGTVVLQPSGNKLVIAGRLTALPAGFHGYHIHAVGVCDPAATDPTGTVVPFLSAGGHLNPGGATHGHHAGDMPVLLVNADGVATSVIETDAVSLAAIFDADGAAIIIHALPDNYANIPTRYSAAGVPGPDAATLTTGDSGGRIACGVITR